MNKQTAQRISELMVKCGRELDESVDWVMTESSEEEAATYKAAIAKILTDLLIEIMNPIYRMYPDLTPEELVGTIPNAGNQCKIHSQVGFDSAESDGRKPDRG